MKLKTNYPGTRLSVYVMPLILIACFFIPSFMFGQAKTITGNVTGSDGSPVAGVTVQEKGAPTGTTTDASGNFSLVVSKPDATIVVSSLGLISQTIALAGRSALSISLKAGAAKELEQVVVIGYGTASKRDLTGSIVKISGKDV